MAGKIVVLTVKAIPFYSIVTGHWLLVHPQITSLMSKIKQYIILHFIPLIFIKYKTNFRVVKFLAFLSSL